MKTIFTGDIQNISIQVTDDPSVTPERVMVAQWSHAEMRQLSGVDIPEGIELLSIEPHRRMAAVQFENEDTAQIFEAVVDAPQWMQDLWAKRDLIRNHARAKWMQSQDSDFYDYEFDEAQNKIVKTEKPWRQTKLASGELSKTKIGCRVIVDLIDILLAKGILSQSDLPDYLQEQATTIRGLVDQIDWELM